MSRLRQSFAVPGSRHSTTPHHERQRSGAVAAARRMKGEQRVEGSMAEEGREYALVTGRFPADDLKRRLSLDDFERALSFSGGVALEQTSAQH